MIQNSAIVRPYSGTFVTFGKIDFVFQKLKIIEIKSFFLIGVNANNNSF